MDKMRDGLSPRPGDVSPPHARSGTRRRGGGGGSVAGGGLPARRGGARAGHVCSEGGLGAAVRISKCCSSSTDLI